MRERRHIWNMQAVTTIRERHHVPARAASTRCFSQECHRSRFCAFSFWLMDEFWLDGSSITTHFKNAKERGSNSLSGPTHHTQPINTQGHSHKSQRPEHCWCCSGTTIRYVVLSLHRCHRDHRDHRCYSCCFVHRRLAGSTPIIVELRIESNRPRRQNQTLFAPSSRA